MAFDKAQLIADLVTIFEDLDPSNTAAGKANEVATAIDDFVNSRNLGDLYLATALTGGIDNALDHYDGSILADLDAALVVTATQFYVYTLDADSGLPESSHDVISPDTNPGDKRWILLETIGGGVTDHGELTGLDDPDHNAAYLYKENTDAFTPDGNYEPATKKYVDDAVAGVEWDGDITDIDLDGGIDIGEDLADDDEWLVYNKSGAVMRKLSSSRLKTYLTAALTMFVVPNLHANIHSFIITTSVSWS